jgi:predicted transcriptional regulator
MKPADTGPTAERLMQRNVLTLEPQQPVADAVQTLLHKGISGAPVVVDGKVVGMFSERDCVIALVTTAYHADHSGTVAEHMRRKFEMVGPDADLLQLAHLFKEVPVRRFVVVDQDNRLLGLITRRAVMLALDEMRRAREEVRPPTSYESIVAADRARY